VVNFRASSRPSRDSLLLAAYIISIAVVASSSLADTDPYWQVRAGQEALAGATGPVPDTWSWAPVDGLFYSNSPAWNAVLGAGWAVAGSWGLFLVSVGSIAVSLGVVAWVARRLGATTLPTLGVIVLLSLAALPLLSPRAALPAQALVLAAIGWADWWTRRLPQHRGRASAAVPLLVGVAFSVTGNWIHLSWSTFALAVAAAWAVMWLVTPGLSRVFRFALVVSGSIGLVVGILLGPYGTDVYGHTADVVEACRGLITEWINPFAGAFGARWWPLAVAVLCFMAGVAAWCVRRWTRSRGTDPTLTLSIALLVVSVPYTLGALVYVRFVLLSAFLLSPLAAAAATALLRRISRRAADVPAGAGLLRSRAAEWASPGFWRVVMTATILVLAPFVVMAGSRHAEPPTATVNAMLPSGCQQFGTPAESASLILMRPDVPVWIDGRFDYWGRSRIEAAYRYLYQGNQETLVPPGTTCVLLADPATDGELVPLVKALDADPGWTRVAGTQGALLWLPAEMETSTAP